MVALSLLLCVLTAPARLHSHSAATTANQAQAGQTQPAQAQAASSPNLAALDRDIAETLLRLETALASGDPAQYLTLVSPSADRALAEDFARAVVHPGATR